MVQINAGQRLVTATADAKLARKYLTALGIRTGKILDNAPGAVHFETEDGDAALVLLKKKFKPRQKPIKLSYGTIYIFGVEKGRTIELLMRKDASRPSVIALEDAEDYAE